MDRLVKAKLALSLAMLGALSACDGLSGSPYEIRMEMRGVEGSWLSAEEKAALESELLAEWGEAAQCVEPPLFGDWKSIVQDVAEMGADRGCEIEVTDDGDNSYAQVLLCTGDGDGGFVSDGTELTATTTASREGDTLQFETRYSLSHKEIGGDMTYILAGTGSRVEVCGT